MAQILNLGTVGSNILDGLTPEALVSMFRNVRGGNAGPIITPIVVPYLYRATSADFINGEVISDSISFGNVDIAKRATVSETGVVTLDGVDDQLVAAASVDMTNNTLIFSYTATDSKTSAGYLALTGSTNYLEVTPRIVGENQNRIRVNNLGTAFTSLDPVDWNNVRYNVLGQQTVVVVQITETEIVVTANDNTVIRMPRAGGTAIFDAIKLGTGRLNISGGMEFYDVAIVGSVDPYILNAALTEITGTGPTPTLSRSTGIPILILGDSIANGSTATDEGSEGFLAQAAHTIIADDTRKSLPGALMCPAGEVDQAKIDASFPNITALPTTYNNEKFCFVMFSTNDWDRGYSPLGTPDDITPTTWWGSYNVGRDNIIANAPDMEIILVTTYYSSAAETRNAQGLNLNDYRLAILQAGERDGFQVVDLGGLITPETEHLYMNDILHPNTAGHNLAVARAAAALIPTERGTALNPPAG